MSKPKYAFDGKDTNWDDWHRERGMMTNREFFTGSGPGTFYEGMEWDEEDQEWIPNAEQSQAGRNRCKKVSLVWMRKM